jgi:hypothetical protein
LELQPLTEIWDLTQRIKDKTDEWKKSLISQLNYEEIDREMKAFNKQTQTVKIKFEDFKKKEVKSQRYAKILNQVVRSNLETIQEFKKHVPLASVFSNKGLEPRHWAELQNIVNKDLEADATLEINPNIKLF